MTTTWGQPSEEFEVDADGLGATPTSTLVWNDLAMETITVSGETLPVLFEWVVRAQILEMRSTTAKESRRALRELPTKFRITTRDVVVDERSEEQSVYHYVTGLQPPPFRFVSSGGRRERELPPHDEALAEFLGPLARELGNEPEANWRGTTFKYLETMEEKSPWADAVGLLYSRAGIGAALGIPDSQLSSAIKQRLLLTLETIDGQLLFPASQVRRDGKLVRGLPWVLSQLGEELVDRYTLAAWLHQGRERFAGLSVWETLQDNEDLPDSVRELVSEFRTSISR